MKRLIIKFLAKVFSYLKDAYYLDIYASYRRRYNIHKSFIFNGDGTLVYGEGEINAGEQSYIGRFSTLQVSPKTKIVIGSKCRIGPFFKIWTQSGNVDSDFHGLVEPKLGDVIIGDAVWIGANVLITPGVNIGSNSIIGANSIVTNDVPDFAIFGGVPAKLIRFKNIDGNEINR